MFVALSFTFLLHFTIGMAKQDVYWQWPFVCLSCAAFLHYYMDPDVTLRNGRGFPIVVHYWANLQLMHRFCCCGNIDVCIQLYYRPTIQMHIDRRQCCLDVFQSGLLKPDLNPILTTPSPV